MKFASPVTAVKKLISARVGKEIARKLAFTALILVIFRILAAVPLPGVNPDVLTQVTGGTPFSNIFTLISGGRLDTPSLAAIGIAPYINASIIIQLMTSVIPHLEDLSKQGELGRRRINQYTRLLALPLSVLQAFVIYSILTNPAITGSSAISEVLNNLSRGEMVTLLVTLASGSFVLMWLGELITEYGIGNGASVIIAFGIISSLPGLVLGQLSTLSEDWQNFLNGNLQSLFSNNFTLLYLVLALIAFLTFVIIFANESARRVPIMYARRFRGGGATSSYLPLKLTQAGVMPVIFAQALLTFPLIAAEFILSIREAGRLFDFATAVRASKFFQTNNYENILLLAGLIIVFTYFYTTVVVKPDELAKNLQKSGAYIPGVRPGGETTRKLNYIINRLMLFGGITLAIIAIAPSLLLLFEATQSLTILTGLGGTSLLIVISTFMDGYRKMASLKSIQNYEEFSRV